MVSVDSPLLDEMNVPSSHVFYVPSSREEISRIVWRSVEQNRTDANCIPMRRTAIYQYDVMKISSSFRTLCRLFIAADPAIVESPNSSNTRR